MSGTAKVALAGAILAIITAGLGVYGLSDWDGETGGHWISLAGFTLFFPLLHSGSWVVALACHWLACTAVAGTVWGFSRLVSRAMGGDSTGTVPFAPPEPAPDAWVPPTAEEIARVVPGRGEALPPQGPAD